MHGHGFGPGFGGPGGFGGHPFGKHGRGHGRARRGDVQPAILALLAEQDMHGYQIIQELTERSGGAWTPSPGSVYPTLQMLEEGGLVTGAEQDGKRVYTITDTGRAELEQRTEAAGGTPPWLDGGKLDGFGQLRQSVFKLIGAAKQVAVSGNGEHVAAATAIVDEARRKLYHLLAEA